MQLRVSMSTYQSPILNLRYARLNLPLERPRMTVRGLSRCFLFAAAATLLLMQARAQLIVDVPLPTISSDLPSITVVVANGGSVPLSLGGMNLVVTIGSGSQGPTLNTTIPTPPQPAMGVDLLSGMDALFHGNPLGQFPIGTPQERQQGWSVLTLTPVSLAPGQTKDLATLTFDSFPVGGPFSLSFAGTSFADSTGGTVSGIMLPNVQISVVPEPAATGAVCGLALVAVAFVRRVQRRPVAGR